MIELNHILLHVFPFGLPDLGRMNVNFLFSFAYYEVSAKQLSNLRKKVMRPLERSLNHYCVIPFNVAGK